MVIPPHPDLARVTCSAEFNNLVEHIKRELQVSIFPNFKRFGSSSSTSSSSPTAVMNGKSTNTPSPVASSGTRESPTEIQHPSDYTFKFRCQRSNTDFLPTAREMLEQFLTKHHVFGYPSGSSASTATSGSAISATSGSAGAAAASSGATAGMTNTGQNLLHRRTDSFADAFPHFDSRVLASNVGPGTGSGFGSVLSRARGHGKSISDHLFFW